MICYLWCFEKCVQFINKNAYIWVIFIRLFIYNLLVQYVW